MPQVVPVGRLPLKEHLVQDCGLHMDAGDHFASLAQSLHYIVACHNCNKADWHQQVIHTDVKERDKNMKVSQESQMLH